MAAWGQARWIIALLGMLVLASTTHAEPGRWLHVDTQANTLSLMKRDHQVRQFSNIAIGRRGTTRHPRSGDNRTPLGEFRIGWINEDSRYHLFLGLTFPNWSQANHAWQTGLIDADTYETIVRALRNQRVPPQDTPLGGYLGIHGLGAVPAALHRQLNWTKGCIAVTNRQIEILRQWVMVGTKVVVD